MATKDVLGRAGEDRAVDFVETLGWEVLDRNWRTDGGEIDIVARDGETLVAIEVKTRTSAAFGHPFEAIHPFKRTRLFRLAWAWRDANPDVAPAGGVRVDLIGIVGADPRDADLEHLRDLP